MSEVEPPRIPLYLRKDLGAAETIQRINGEAGTFLGFTFTFYAVQLTAAGANFVTAHPAGPWDYLIPLLLMSDFLTAVFALSAIARFDLGFEIARIYRPWPTVKDILDQERSASDWFPRQWFKLEEAFSKRVPKGQGTPLTRTLEWVAPARQGIIIAVLTLVLLGTNYFALR